MTVERIERLPGIADRAEILRELFPEAHAEGQLDASVLRSLLGSDAGSPESGAAIEHYGLNWPGKRDARKLASKAPSATLRPLTGQGVNENSTQNALIIGDNLEVLRLLQKSYAGAVRAIYIDPPYNTGSDLIYKDDFRDPVAVYLEATNQADFSGVLTSNPKSGGRFHTRWLNMIYPRLVLGRNLLTEDGAMWISVDDIEVANLRLVCDELFGSENHVATFIWEKRTTRENRKVFSVNHDYIVCYALNKDKFQAARNMLPMTSEVLGRYENEDNDPRGPWQSVSLNAQAGHATKGQFYTVVTPGGRKLDPPPGRCWSVTEDKMKALIADNRVWFGEKGNNVPRRKVFLEEAREGLTPHTLWTSEEVGTNDSAKKALIKLFDGVETFDTPKPVELVQRILQIGTRPRGEERDEIVLDFFAGSGTTGEAVMRLNQQDGGSRRFILVQLPEKIDNAVYPTIAEITMARLRKVSAALAASSAQTEMGGAKPDLGFRVLEEHKSSVQRWLPYEGGDGATLSLLYRTHDGLVSGWSVENLLIEVMLIEGYPLDARRTQSPDFLDNVVYVVEHPRVSVRLLVCLDGEISDGTVDKLAEFEKDTFVCCESALNDPLKLRIADAVHRVRTL